MNVIQRSPWQLLDGLHRDAERFFAARPALRAADAATGWIPAVDVREEAGRFVFSVDLPGVDPQAIEITLDRGTLSITGRREVQQAGDGFLRRERVRGEFVRRFKLPDTVADDGIEAESRHGVLTVSIPKRTESRRQKIEVTAH
jgi:HSP20 family protein